MTAKYIGTRIKALREERELSQCELAQLLGFKNLRTISDIETGARRVTADELMLAVEKLGVSLKDLTDPFRLTCEGSFSWRQTGVSVEQLRKCERDAGRLIAAFRFLAPLVGRKFTSKRPEFSLTSQSSCEDAMQAGERFVADFNLGRVPALHLAEVMERELGILVLMVDAVDGISGAACRLPELDAVLIARGEVRDHRNFDLAHELFHILTWDAMPPEHSEEATETGGSRMERLADNFAAAVLMPAFTVKQFGNWSNLTEESLIAKLNFVADELRVTSSAMRWRLAALGELGWDVANSLPRSALRNNGHDVPIGSPPKLFSKPFVEVLDLAIARGHVSILSVASLLDLTIDGLADLFEDRGIAHSIDL